MANAIIYAGMAWEGQIHTCQLYDRACRVKQCFRCYNYGHIGAQCDAAQTCGYCAELHETKYCKQKGAEGFTPRCAVCKAAHTAWSNACPARKKEMGRVEQAKQIRSTYWQVLRKDDPPSDDNPRTTRRRARNAGPDRPTTASATLTDETSAPEGPEVTETQAPLVTITVQSPPDMPTVEEWATPASQQEPNQQQQTINLQTLTTGPLAVTDQAEGRFPNLDTIDVTPAEAIPIQPSIYPIEEEQEEFDFGDADDWLANLADDINEDWMNDRAETAISPPTSLVTDTRTTQGTIYKGCRCPSHQDAYNGWPGQDAELTISHCMRICVYCGKDYSVAAALRKHMRKKYASRNITVAFGTGGKGSSSTPGWTSKSRTGPPTSLLRVPIRRSRSLTNSTNAAPAS